jgi:ATP-dependent Clp protease adaptor protein ClpS
MAEDQAANVAVIEPDQETERRQETDQRKKPKRQPRYHVILWDDQHHTHAYVMVMLQKLFGHPLEKGFILAQEVDTKGKAVVLTTTREHAELKRDQIHAFGKDGMIASCKGSMSASIEPEIG